MAIARIKAMQLENRMQKVRKADEKKTNANAKTNKET